MSKDNPRSCIYNAIGTISSRSIAFAIVFSLLIAPFPAPFIYQKGEPLPSHKELSKEVQKALEQSPQQLTLYSKSVAEPVVIASTVESTTTPATPTQELENDIPAKISTSHINNSVSAELIALGSTASEVEQVALDNNGNVALIEDIHGAVTTASYNDEGYPVEIINADGSSMLFVYDNEGNVLKTVAQDTVQPLFSGTSLFDTVANFIFIPITSLANDDESVQFDYEDGDMLSAENDNGEVEFEYTEDGQVARELRSDGSVVEYSYDELGNVIERLEYQDTDSVAIIDSFVSLVAYVFTGEKLNARASVGSDYMEEIAYNSNNYLEIYKVSRAVETTLSADTLAPVTLSTTTTSAETFDISSTSTEPVLEASTTTIELPQIQSSTTPDTSVSGVMGRLYEVIASAFSESTFAYAQEADLEVAATSTPAIIESVSMLGTVLTADATLFAVDYTHSMYGSLTQAKYSWGHTKEIERDALELSLGEKVVSQDGSVISSSRYERNSEGLISARTINNKSESYMYSDLGLESIGSASYTYDENGNRLTKTESLVTDVYTYTGNRLESVSGSSNAHYTYSDNGAVTSYVKNGITVYLDYTPTGAIESISYGDTKITYEYDALNRRASRTQTTGSVTSTQTYTYAADKLVKVVDGVHTRDYFYTPTGELVAMMINGVLYATYTNEQGSVIATVSTATGEKTLIHYDAWGAMSVQGNTTVDLGFVGAFYEQELGLSILGPRVYDPSLGRFLQKDPLPGTVLNELSQNEYIYSLNDPVNHFDPTGHAPEVSGSSNILASIAATSNTIETTKESIAEIKQFIASLENEIATLATDTSAQKQAVAEAGFALILLESTLEDLYASRESELAIKSVEAEIIVPTSSATVDTTAPTSATVEPSTTTTSSTTEVQAVEIATSTQAVEEAPVALPELIQSTTPEEPTEPVSGEEVEPVSPTSFIGPFQLIAKFVDDNTLKVEAKKKKKKSSRSKSLSKHNKKKKADTQAKYKKEKKAKELAKKKKADRKAKEKAKKAKEKLKQAERNAKEQAKKLQKQQKKLERELAKIEKESLKTIKALEAAPAKQVTKPPVAFASNDAVNKIVVPNAQATAGMSSTTQNLFTIDNAHVVLTACGFEQTFIGAGCGIIDGVLYAFQGDWIGAGLSGLSAIPLIGGFADSARTAKVTAKAVQNASQVSHALASLTKASSVPDLITIAKGAKVAAASSDTVYVLAGSADDGRKVFDSVTSGWETVYESSTITTRHSLDGLFALTYRTKSSGPALAPFKTINATIDAFKLGPGGKFADGIEIKFAQ
jgi:RHS repeat-associated protein